MLEGLRTKIAIRTRLRRVLGLPPARPERPPAPPPEISGGVGHGDFWSVGDRTAELVREWAGHRYSDRILDIGCGAGRVAWPLSLNVGSRGSYLGFDVVPQYVDWCRNELRLDPARFAFEHHVVHSTSYNTEAETAPENFRFPWPEASFDLVIATSLFTHLLPAATEHYLAEARRMLKPKGRLFASFFLVDKGSIGPIERQVTYPVFTEKTEWGWLQDPKVPEDGVAFDRAWLLGKLDRLGYTRVNVHEGTWRGPQARYYQDVLVARAS